MMRERLTAFVLAVFVAAAGSLFGAIAPVAASPNGPAPRAPGDQCTVELWRKPSMFAECARRLDPVSDGRGECLDPPTAAAPDSGMAGWFASMPESSKEPGPKGNYSRYGYAGYSYETYDVGCGFNPQETQWIENRVANGEFMISSAIVGASNALRERAWQPSFMWGWADPLVDQATKAVYQKVFTVFGAITLAVVGLYLLWRSRQSDMSAAMTTAGWAVLVMVGVTAVASWPTWAANSADRTLTSALSVVHQAVGPPDESMTPDRCDELDPNNCKDRRPPAVRASDTATDGLVYRQWLRGLLGSADSETARKYGPVLYDAKALTWAELQETRGSPTRRQEILEAKRQRWLQVAEQIKKEDPEAYEYLSGKQGMERIGAGFIAILSALFFAMFDITASLLVLLGFLIFRWAVVAAPILGTVGLFRPASNGLRRLVNAVVAAIFNIVIFGTGAAIYLFAVTLILGTASLPGWLQVVLIWLTGIVGWLLLRPYRRITQLGGKNPSKTIASIGNWHRLFVKDMRAVADGDVAEGGRGQVGEYRGRSVVTIRNETRPEARHEDVTVMKTTVEAKAADQVVQQRRETQTDQEPERLAQPATKTVTTVRTRTRVERWAEADVPDEPVNFAIYRPDTGETETISVPRRRPEARPVPIVEPTSVRR